MRQVWHSLALTGGILLGAGVGFAQVEKRPTPEPTDPAAYPSVAEIIHGAVARATSQDEAGAELEFESRIVVVTESLSRDHEVTKTETALYRRFPLEGVLYDELIEKDGRPLTEKEAREVRKKREAFVREVRERTRKGKEIETNDERQVRFSRELIARYRASVVGTEVVRGEPCWVLFFEPREGKLPENNRIDKALNRSTGRIYISQVDYGIVQIDFEMQKPVKYLWGFFATLRHAAGRLEFERVGPNVWLPQLFDLEIDLRIFFRGLRRHVTREWVQRQPLDLATGVL